jgi:hypothetical protein
MSTLTVECSGTRAERGGGGTGSSTRPQRIQHQGQSQAYHSSVMQRHGTPLATTLAATPRASGPRESGSTSSQAERRAPAVSPWGAERDHTHNRAQLEGTHVTRRGLATAVALTSAAPPLVLHMEAATGTRTPVPTVRKGT